MIRFSKVLKKVRWVDKSGRTMVTLGSRLVQVPLNLNFGVKHLPALGTACFVGWHRGKSEELKRVRLRLG